MNTELKFKINKLLHEYKTTDTINSGGGNFNLNLSPRKYECKASFLKKDILLGNPTFRFTNNKSTVINTTIPIKMQSDTKILPRETPHLNMLQDEMKKLQRKEQTSSLKTITSDISRKLKGHNPSSSISDSFSSRKTNNNTTISQGPYSKNSYIYAGTDNVQSKLRKATYLEFPQK